MSSAFVGIQSNLIGAATGSVSITPPVFLGGFQLTASAPAFPSIAIPAFNSLQVNLFITGYGGSDVVSLQFNGDTGTNYADRTITAVAGGVVLVDTPTSSTTLLRCGLPTAQGRVAQVNILNNATRRKVVVVNNQIGAADATAPATITLGALGLWNNTTAQIVSILCLTAGGLNILAGSSITVWGSF
jgi:hypothetical protein